MPDPGSFTPSHSPLYCVTVNAPNVAYNSFTVCDESPVQDTEATITLHGLMFRFTAIEWLHITRQVKALQALNKKKESEDASS